MNNSELKELSLILKELEHRSTGRKIDTFFSNPNDGYTKHRDFFKAGANHRQRLLIAANRVGKSLTVGVELTYHLTGQYPTDWQGHRFTTCNQWWAVGDTKQTTRDVLQLLLLGPVGEFGTGLIPRDCIDFDTLTDAKKADTPIDTVRVRFVNGTYSTLTFKSSEQGRKAFQGTAVSIWLDEECPYAVYEECLTRIATGDNILMMSFTPLQGMTDVVSSFMQDGDIMSEGTTGDSKYVVRATWDDAPHLTEEIKRILWNSYAPFQREARSKGIPALGAGSIYPVAESAFVVDPFEIPKHWPKGYGFDVGRNTAAVWIALDRDSSTLYVYSDMLVVEGMPSSHAAAIQARGKWIRGAIDTAARGRSQTDGENLFQMYRDLGLNNLNADKAVEAGLYEVLELLTQGRLKVFNTCVNLIKEFRGYQRDEKGRIVKKNDHVMDAWRYAIHTRDKILWTEAEANAYNNPDDGIIDLEPSYNNPDSWMIQ